MKSEHFLVWSWAAEFKQPGDEATRDDSDNNDRETPGPAIFGPLNPHVSYSDYSQSFSFYELMKYLTLLEWSSVLFLFPMFGF